MNIFVLDAYVSPLSFCLMYKNTASKTRERENTAPPTAPIISGNLLLPLCFLGDKTVTCGVSIEGLIEKSLQKVVEKERHRFPDALQERKKTIHQDRRHLMKQK